MHCIKTGCHVRICGEYGYGDAYEMNGWLVVRLCQTAHEPVMYRLHFEVDTWEQWFDRMKTSHSQNSTLLVKPGDWRQLGDYHGVSI